MAARTAVLPPHTDFDARPGTIPALREWTPGNGAFQLSKASRVVLSEANPPLEQMASLFADEVASRSGLRPAIAIDADGTVRAGDVRLAKGSIELVEPNEGYRLEIGTSVTIRALSDAGIFYGTRTLLQMLDRANRIPAGVAVDWPRYPERGLMVDIARKRYSAAWLEQRIRELAYLKMNYLHLHISDDKGFGIETPTVPQESLPNALPLLSKVEVQHLVTLAEAHFVKLIPEIDMPGHMGAILKLPQYESYRYSDGPGKEYPNVLDITNRHAVVFAKSLITEFATLFRSDSWHSGGDEIFMCFASWCHPKLTEYARTNAPEGTERNRLDGKDALHLFFNGLRSHVHEKDMKLRVWNDELRGGDAIPLDPEIIVHWWIQFSILSDWISITPGELLRANHLILNNGVWPTYYVLGAPAWLPNASMKSAYESWEVNQFAGYAKPIGSRTIPEGETRNLGAGLCIWADNPDAETEKEVAEHVYMRLRVIAQKTWSSKPIAAEYESFVELAKGMPQAPNP